MFGSVRVTAQSLLGPTVNILPPFAFLTKGTKKETMGKFMAKPMTLFHYQRGVTSGCGLGLAFRVNFTFSLMPQFGTAGSNGFALVIAAKPKVGKPAGVGYSGLGLRSIAVVFDTLPNDVGEQHVGLCINGTEECLVKEVSPFTLTDGDSYKVWVDYEPGDPGTIQVFLASSNTKPDEPLLLGRVSLCAVLQPGVKQPAFSFGFVASTTVKAVLFKDQALGLSLSEDTFAPSRGSPFSRYVSSDFELSATKKDAWRLRDFHTWDSVDFLGWPVKNQRDCNACWAYAVVASVEAAYGIAKQQSAPQLSVEALFALMGLSDSDKCSAGGSPTQALEKLVALDASSGLTGDSDPATTYPVQSFERARFKGYVGLMMAVQNQPVVVHIQASAATFVMYDGNRIAPPFWIIRNSWGEEWGDKGHIRMDIQGGDGVCGINVLPGIYPVVKIPGDPCGQSSYQGDRPQPVMNPCGRFKCGVTAESTNNCTCNIPTATVQPFVQVVNGDGFTTCAYVNTTATTMTVTGDNWLCSDVHPLVDLSLTDFTDQNAVGEDEGIDCSQPLLKGSVLQLANTPDTPCTAFFYTLNGDTCASMSRQLNFTEADLADLNPGLDCSKPIKAGRSVCLERSDAFAFTVPECVRYGTLTPQDTCEKLLKRTSTSVPPSGGTTQGGASENPWAALYRNNPGLTCSNTIPSSAYATGSRIGVQLGLCNKGRAKRVAPTLTCSGAYRFYGGGAAASAAFADYNGNACAGTVGGKVICVP
ncbi:unnamed protein product [Closterium sp. Naga37s-1]|nr:unnamed protein product [Closterium sp. Naga37s-1]